MGRQRRAENRDRRFRVQVRDRYGDFVWVSVPEDALTDEQRHDLHLPRARPVAPYRDSPIHQ